MATTESSPTATCARRSSRADCLGRPSERGHDDPRASGDSRPDGGGRDAGHARSRHPARPGLLRLARGARGDRRDRPGRRRDRIALRAAPGDRQGEEQATSLRDAASRLNSTVVALHRAELAPSQISEVISAVADALIRRMIELAIEIARARRPPSSAGCRWAATAGASRFPPRTSTPGWRGGTCPSRIPSPRRGARLASSQTEEYMRGIAASVADCVRVIGWRLDPHGVTASGAFSASSIEDWQRAIESWLARPERQPGADRRLDPARRPHRLRARARVRRQASCSSRPAIARPWSAGCSGSPWPRSRPPASCTTSSSRTRASRKGPSTSSTAGCCRSSTWRATPRCARDVRATPTLERLRALRRTGGPRWRPRCGSSRRPTSCSARCGSSTRSRQIEQGREPDDHLDPEQLDPLTRRYLRDAFREVAAVQRWLSGDLSLASRCPSGNHPQTLRLPGDPAAQRRDATAWRDVHLHASSTWRRRASIPPPTRSSPSRPSRSVAARSGWTTPCYELVRPRRMPEGDTIRIHGLREADLAEAPPLEKVLDELLEVLSRQGDGRPRRCGGARHSSESARRVRLGTAKSHRRHGGPRPRTPAAPPGARGESRADRPPNMAHDLGLPVHRPHHADGDALTTAQAFIALATHLEAVGFETLGSLVGLSQERERTGLLGRLLGRRARP